MNNVVSKTMNCSSVKEVLKRYDKSFLGLGVLYAGTMLCVVLDKAVEEGYSIEFGYDEKNRKWFLSLTAPQVV